MKPEAFLKKQNYYRAGRCRNASDSGYNKKETVKKMIGRAKFLIQILYLY
ncbi:hypothetical protein RUMOBE_03548 [Blautia obeum ATCC 29174]|jgi:hypothetical protein|uniref:Uncharacterized protein n=1 Tax=Blautia obeum ATCC 29174 TaxID=411459 RepID=A5ZX03_9FIRM|nr:hypothetical protein RUMOBE_03548 [Blautia obeum ATCC 29174]